MSKTIDTLAIFDESNRLYFTGKETSFGCVLVNANESFLIIDFRYAGYVRDCEGFTVKIIEAPALYDTIRACLGQVGAKVVGFEDDRLSYAEYSRLKSELKGYTLSPAGAVVRAKRAVKTDEEIAKIAASQVFNQTCLKKVVSQIKPGVTEREIAAQLTYEYLRAGAKPSFDPIVAFGANAAVPHHKPSGKKLEKSDVILIDTGAVLDGYCSDMTRTFCLTDPGETMRKVHSIVLEAQLYALKHIKAGMTGREADSLAREYITAHGYGAQFGHSLGHGVGVEIHEDPRLSKFADETLTENMIVTIEPGVYIDGVGGVRIEDMAVVKADGLKNLTDFSKNINL